MLSYKDIKIIETTLESHSEASSDDLAIHKVSQSLVNLLTSRFYWEIKQSIDLFIPKEQLVNVQVSFSDRALAYKPSQSYMKLVNGPVSLFWTQGDIGSLADLIWTGESRERIDSSVYQSDIFISQKFSMYLFECLKKSATPIITLDDYRINEVYKNSIMALQSQSQAFYIDFEFAHFKLSIAGQCHFNDEFLAIKPEHSHFDLAIVTK